jgi:methionine-rich copper-binding protein CopC
MRPLLRQLGLAALAALALLVRPAGAHAFLERAVPVAGSSVHASPTELKLWFTQRVEPAFSKVRVSDGGGKQVDSGDGRVDATDRVLLRVSLPPLAPGTYRVTWRVLSVDSHVTEGDFTFDVAP